MPLFEIDKDGQRFQVEAPDMDSAMQGFDGFDTSRFSTPKAEAGAAPEAKPEDGERWFPNPLTMAANAPSSAAEYVKGTAQAVAHPVETGEQIYNAGWDGVRKFISDRYGSWSNAVRTVESDPVGAMGDAAAVASLIGGGEGFALRAPAIARGLAKAGQVGRALDPLANTAKIAAMPYQAARKGLGLVAQSASSTHGAPSVGAEAGRTSAYGGQLAQKTVGKLGVTGDLAPGQEFKKHMGDTAGQLSGDVVSAFDSATQAVEKNAQTTLDTNLKPLFADRTVLDPKPIVQALKNAEKDAFYAGKPVGTGVAAKVHSEIVDILRTGGAGAKKGATGWLSPPKGAKGAALQKWYDDHWTMEGLDKLKRQIAGVYQGYKMTTPDATAAKVAANVVKSVKDVIDTRAGGKYGQAMADFGKERHFINEIDQMFGASRDTKSRRLTSINRDTAFTDFGARKDAIKTLIKKAGVPQAAHLVEMTAGRTMRGWAPRNLMGFASTGGVAAYFTGSPVALLSAVLHSPRFVGESAYRLGKMEGLFWKPFMAVNRAMGHVKIGGKTHDLRGSARGAALGAGQAGRVANAQGEREQFKTALSAKAKEMGYNIHDRVLSSLTDRIFSENPEAYTGAMETIGRNKRLMQLVVEAARTKGEQ